MPCVLPLRVLACALPLALAATSAEAGAWPREKGGFFLSVRGDYDREDGGNSSLYAEYGLTNRLTLVSTFSTANPPWTTSRASGAVRIALTRAEATHHFALTLGASMPPTVLGAATATRPEVALDWGRGFSSRWGDGWANVTARVLFDQEQLHPITDYLALVGVRPAEGWMTMLAVSRYQDDDGVYWKLSPSLGYAIGKHVNVVPNVTQEFGHDKTTAIGLSVWLQF